MTDKPITDADALRQFPELHDLITLRQAGWTFRPIGNRDEPLIGIVATYTRAGYTDALWIYDRSTVIGVRVLADDNGAGCVWRKDTGTLSEVVQELLALPEPGHRLAPRLIKPWLSP